MTSVAVSRCGSLSGALNFPGDKSLSHRAIIFGCLAEGKSRFTNVLPAEDCVCTREAFKAMGVDILEVSPTELVINGKGLGSLRAPSKPLWMGNSGTAMRLMLGVLAGQGFEATLTGDPSLSSRPMRRVTEPLKWMGAQIEGKDGANHAPLKISGGKLQAIDAKLLVASAQVKSAILLAGLYADGVTRVTEPELSRDHTERFLEYFGVKIGRGDPTGCPYTVSVQGGQTLQARSFEIAGDISGAAFFMAAAVLVPGSKLSFRSVLSNPTRTGVIEVLKRMGVVFGDFRENAGAGPEPMADFTLSPQPLKSFEIKKEELPSLIDEVPILCVLATQAKGTSVIHDASELRVKETDRIRSMTENLSAMGAKIRSQGDSIIIEGPTPLKGARWDSFKDHRTAMCGAIAGLIAEGSTAVDDLDCVNTSFPDFFALLERSGAPLKPRGGR